MAGRRKDKDKEPKEEPKKNKDVDDSLTDRLKLFKVEDELEEQIKQHQQQPLPPPQFKKPDAPARQRVPVDTSDKPRVMNIKDRRIINDASMVVNKPNDEKREQPLNKDIEKREKIQEERGANTIPQGRRQAVRHKRSKNTLSSVLGKIIKENISKIIKSICYDDTVSFDEALKLSENLSQLLKDKINDKTKKALLKDDEKKVIINYFNSVYLINNVLKNLYEHFDNFEISNYYEIGILLPKILDDILNKEYEIEFNEDDIDYLKKNAQYSSKRKKKINIIKSEEEKLLFTNLIMEIIKCIILYNYIKNTLDEIIINRNNDIINIDEILGIYNLLSTEFNIYIDINEENEKIENEIINKMFKYLYEHIYIHFNKSKNPLRKYEITLDSFKKHLKGKLNLTAEQNQDIDEYYLSVITLIYEKITSDFLTSDENLAKLISKDFDFKKYSEEYKKVANLNGKDAFATRDKLRLAEINKLRELYLNNPNELLSYETPNELIEDDDMFTTIYLYLLRNIKSTDKSKVGKSRKKSEESIKTTKSSRYNSRQSRTSTQTGFSSKRVIKPEKYRSNFDDARERSSGDLNEDEYNKVEFANTITRHTLSPQIDKMKRNEKSDIDPVKLVEIYDNLKRLEKIINSINNEENFKEQRAKFSVMESDYNKIIKIYYDSGKEVQLMTDKEKEETKNALLSKMKAMRTPDNSDDESSDPIKKLTNKYPLPYTLIKQIKYYLFSIFYKDNYNRINELDEDCLETNSDVKKYNNEFNSLISEYKKIKLIEFNKDDTKINNFSKKLKQFMGKIKIDNKEHDFYLRCLSKQNQLNEFINFYLLNIILMDTKLSIDIDNYITKLNSYIAETIYEEDMNAEELEQVEVHKENPFTMERFIMLIESIHKIMKKENEEKPPTMFSP